MHKDVIRDLARALSIPVICNGGSGEIRTYEDMERYQDETGTDSVMVARAAQWNPSVFRLVEIVNSKFLKKGNFFVVDSYSEKEINIVT